MNNDDPPPLLVECTNVRVITSPDDIRVALNDPEQCLNLLKNFAGNRSRFVSHFMARDQDDREFVLYTAERTMEADKEKYKEWKKIIRLNQAIRIELLQDTALERLEGNHVGFEEKQTNRGITVIYKEANDLAFGKLLLGDAFAARIYQAKSKPAGPKGNKLDDDDDDDDDDEALARAMEE